MILKQLLITFCMTIILSINTHAAEPVHFTQFNKNDFWGNYVGIVKIFSTLAVDYEDEVAAFVPGDNGQELLVGACVYGDNNQGHFYLPVYLDDQSTLDTKDGASVNDPLTFKVWDKSMNQEFTLTGKQIQLLPEEGLSIPDNGLTFILDSTVGMLHMSVNHFHDGKVELKDVITLMKHLASK